MQLNVWHRWVGKMMFLATLFHVAGYMVLFVKKGELVEVMKELYAGWIAFAGLCLLAVLSLPQIRRSAYAVFWHAHWIGYVMMLVAVSGGLLSP